MPLGEYVPLGDSLPWLYRFTPLPFGIKAVARAEAFELHIPVSQVTETVRAQMPPTSAASYQFSLAPGVCYENVMPQVIRRQMNELMARNSVTPDVLINVSNDGWFWGSSELDLHLRCAQLRTIEARRPMLIAANTGFSAAIDPLGRVVNQGERRTPDILIVNVKKLSGAPGALLTFYMQWGEWAGQLGLAFVCLLLLCRQHDSSPDKPHEKLSIAALAHRLKRAAM